MPVKNTTRTFDTLWWWELYVGTMHYKHHDFLFHSPFTNHIFFLCFRYSMVPALNSIHFKQCTQCIACFVSQSIRERLKINKTTLYVIGWFPFFPIPLCCQYIAFAAKKKREKKRKKNLFNIRSMAQVLHIYMVLLCIGFYAAIVLAAKKLID